MCRRSSTIKKGEQNIFLGQSPKQRIKMAAKGSRKQKKVYTELNRCCYLQCIGNITKRSSRNINFEMRSSIWWDNKKIQENKPALKFYMTQELLEEEECVICQVMALCTSLSALLHSVSLWYLGDEIIITNSQCSIQRLSWWVTNYTSLYLLLALTERLLANAVDREKKAWALPPCCKGCFLQMLAI